MPNYHRFMSMPWMHQAASRAEAAFASKGIKLTLGGEPTFIPVHPEGAEWSVAATGPTKLAYAWKVARNLQRSRLPGSAAFFCPGKSYPGEINPRWVVKLLANRDGSPLYQPLAKGKRPGPETLAQFAAEISRNLGLKAHWKPFTDPNNEGSEVLVMPLDFEDGHWRCAPWTLRKSESRLLQAEGPAGLRLPLHLLPFNLPRRVMTVAREGGKFAVFFPPVTQRPFLSLIAAVEAAGKSASVGPLELQGYLPPDEENLWTVLGLTADPGVLEINLPACASWAEYAEWMEVLSESCEQAGLRSWKETPWNHPEGTGGGNHLLWGGPSLETHPFFTRPAWLAAILRFWQHHPSLAYVFTGCYVGTSSQAPRPDESARDLYDLEMAYSLIESLPPGDHRGLINETLRHLHTDVTGNAHRSEISFDKFWNVGWPSGAHGLIEFRAVESLPRADWMSAVALLWTCLAARLLDAPAPRGLKPFGRKLHDEYFLPSLLWSDLEDIFQALNASGYKLDQNLYRTIWDWRFPVLLDWKKSSSRLTVRKGLENWPLLCETPQEGGTTSRFVDTSMQRLEFRAEGDFAETHHIHVAGRLLTPREAAPGVWFAGLRYRHTSLYPSLHPGIPVQLPLTVTILEVRSGRTVAEFILQENDREFQKAPAGSTRLGGAPCRGGRRGDLTCDLRLE